MGDLPHPYALTRQHQEHTAVCHTDRMYTWDQLLGHAQKIGRLLARRSVGENDRVAVVVDREPELLPLLLGCVQQSVIPVLQSRRFPVSELARQAEYTGCRFELVLPERSASTGLRRIDLPDITSATSETGIASDWPQQIPVDQPATILFTSGSSDRPKAALHTFGNHYYSALGSNLNLPFGPGDRWLGSLPFYHIGGLGMLFRALVGGGAIVLPNDSLTMADQIIRDRVTHLSLVPTQLQQLLADALAPSLKNALKAILLGGGPIPKQLIAQARELGLPVFPTYGLTEMSSQVATASPTEPECARALEHRDLSVSGESEILVRGACLFAGYVEPDKIWRPVDADGWFRTGDIGQFDNDGGLVISGRKDNMFISGGENIHPETVESALVAIEGIDEAVIVPVEDQKYGQRPVAFLKYLDGLSLSNSRSNMTEEARLGYDHLSLEAELEQTLPRFMLPRTYYPWPHGYEPTGLKTDRQFFIELAARLQAHHK